jgi:hypothetical protein
MRYKGFQIPTDWMLETGIVSQVIYPFPTALDNYWSLISAMFGNSTMTRRPTNPTF